MSNEESLPYLQTDYQPESTIRSTQCKVNTTTAVYDKVNIIRLGKGKHKVLALSKFVLIKALLLLRWTVIT